MAIAILERLGARFFIFPLTASPSKADSAEVVHGNVSKTPPRELRRDVRTRELYDCVGCGWIWAGRKRDPIFEDPPQMCPNCRTRNWKKAASSDSEDAAPATQQEQSSA